MVGKAGRVGVGVLSTVGDEFEILGKTTGTPLDEGQSLASESSLLAVG